MKNLVSSQMASLEERVINTMLARIRVRRDVPSSLHCDLRVHSSVGGAPVRLREALFSDFRDVAELKRRCGLLPDSFQNWERLWRRNPALRQVPFERPMVGFWKLKGGWLVTWGTF